MISCISLRAFLTLVHQTPLSLGEGRGCGVYQLGRRSNVICVILILLFVLSCRQFNADLNECASSTACKCPTITAWSFYAFDTRAYLCAMAKEKLSSSCLCVMLTGDNYGRIFVSDAQTGEVLNKIAPQHAEMALDVRSIRSIRLSSDFRHIAFSVADSSARLENCVFIEMQCEFMSMKHLQDNMLENGNRKYCAMKMAYCHLIFSNSMGIIAWKYIRLFIVRHKENFSYLWRAVSMK